MTAVGNHKRLQTRGCSYSFWTSDDERCVARNMLSS